MKKLNSFFLLGMGMLLMPALASCGNNSSDAINLRVLNCEDYIGESEIEPYWESERESLQGVIEAFEAYEWEVNGKRVNVIYDTFDTNETMLSSLKTGKSTYDLICPSDYAIQKMMRLGMLEPFDEDGTPIYNQYVSSHLHSEDGTGVFDKISATIGDGTDEKHPLHQYARGYMWGTLGVLYNPEKVASDKGLDEDTVKWDTNKWSSLWDEKYHGEMSIKDSMRDTYSVGIMEVFDEEIREEMAKSGCFDEDLNLIEGKYEEAVSVYGDKLSKIFNRCDQDTVSAVEKSLLRLKANVFGFEVDSGKDDIIKGLVGMNLAWSGDAVYSMDRGDNESGRSIYYSIPETGGNIWFDGWVMPKSNSLHKAEAQEFVDFLSSPEIASANMGDIGYTSCIAGDTVLDLVRQWYDPRAYAMYVYHDASNDEGCTWEDSDFLYDEDGELVYQDGTGEHDGDDYGAYDMTGSTYEEAVVDGVAMSWLEYQELVNLDAESEEDEIEWSIRDLTYMFEGTLEEVSDDLGLIPDANPYLFYSDELETIADPEGGEREIEVGRQFYAQYPDQTLIPKLSCMEDYGEQNRYVLTMWENVKGNNLPIWGVVVFAILLATAAIGITASLITKAKVKKIKVARRKEISANLDK